MRSPAVVLAAFACLTCAPRQPASAPARDPADNELLTRVSLLLLLGGAPACGAVATGPRELTTAEHCVDGSDGPYTFQTRAGALLTAMVTERYEYEDVARLEPEAELPLWVPTAPAVEFRAATLVRPFRGWRVSPTVIYEHDSQVMTPVNRGDSGSGVFVAGALVGVLSTCDAPSKDSPTCNFSGGHFAPVIFAPVSASALH